MISHFPTFISSPDGGIDVTLIIFTLENHAQAKERRGSEVERDWVNKKKDEKGAVIFWIKRQNYETKMMIEERARSSMGNSIWMCIKY